MTLALRMTLGVQGDVVLECTRDGMVFEVTGAGVVVGARVDPSTSLRMTLRTLRMTLGVRSGCH